MPSLQKKSVSGYYGTQGQEEEKIEEGLPSEVIKQKPTVSCGCNKFTIQQELVGKDTGRISILSTDQRTKFSADVTLE